MVSATGIPIVPHNVRMMAAIVTRNAMSKIPIGLEMDIVVSVICILLKYGILLMEFFTDFILSPLWCSDGGKYLSPECNNDGGDCRECLQDTGANPKIIGDGVCQLWLNTTACNFDGGDCMTTYDLPFCDVLVDTFLGDGYCHGGEYNTEDCGWDHGDCDECMDLIDDPSLLGDGECNLENNITECNYDAGDCWLDDGNDDIGYYGDDQYYDE